MNAGPFSLPTLSTLASGRNLQVSRHARSLVLDDIPPSFPFVPERSPIHKRFQVNFTEFRGNGPPHSSLGSPADVYFDEDTTRPELYAKLENDWVQHTRLRTRRRVVHPYLPDYHLMYVSAFTCHWVYFTPSCTICPIRKLTLIFHTGHPTPTQQNDATSGTEQTLRERVNADQSQHKPSQRHSQYQEGTSGESVCVIPRDRSSFLLTEQRAAVSIPQSTSVTSPKLVQSQPLCVCLSRPVFSVFFYY
jgi:hypothetical protein